MPNLPIGIVKIIQAVVYAFLGICVLLVLYTMHYDKKIGNLKKGLSHKEDKMCDSPLLYMVRLVNPLAYMVITVNPLAYMVVFVN